MKTKIFITLLLFCSIFLLQGCECNDGEIIIPCSNKIDLGTFEIEKNLPTESDFEVLFENQFGEEKTLYYNTDWGLGNRNFEDMRSFVAHTNQCSERGDENEISWQREQNTVVVFFDLDNVISIKETVAIDIEKPKDGIVGQYFIARTQGERSGGLNMPPTLSFSKNRIQTSQNSSYDFGYEFFQTLLLNGQEFENVIRILDTQNEIKEIYLSEKGELIAFEDIDDGIFVLKQ